MKNNEILTKATIDILNAAVTSQKRIFVRDKNNIVDTYDDASGQRGAYLSFFSYSSKGINVIAPNEMDPLCYYVRRKLTFTNKGDEGKEDAILLRIHGNNIAKAKEIEITNCGINIDGLQIQIYD